MLPIAREGGGVPEPQPSELDPTGADDVRTGCAGRRQQLRQTGLAP